MKGMELAASRAREPESTAVSGGLSPQQHGRNLPAHVSLPPRRRPRNSAQAPAENLLPDIGCRPRGPPGWRGSRPAPRLRLVLPLLSRSRALPRSRRHARSTCCSRPSVRPPIRPAAAARCRPTGAAAQLHIVSTSSSTTTQLLHAVGCAEAGRYFSRHPEAAARRPTDDYRAFHDVEFHGDEVVFTSLGEGSTSQGEFWEALNTASNQKLPVIFCVEDNGYAISVPVEVNTPGGNISQPGRQLPQLLLRRGGWHRSRSLPARFSGCCRPLPRRARARLRPRPRASALTPTHSLTTTSSTAPPPSARPTPCATPWPRCRCACCAKAS